MSNAKVNNKLLKAAQTGDIAALDGLLGVGASLEATDLNGKTPLHLAAEAGRRDAFHELLRRGANQHAIALGGTDLLEHAASGGNSEIVRFLLDQGHPVNGRWQPRTRVAEQMGHMTPLICAAINARVEVVAILLAAGANRQLTFDKQTALVMVNEQIRHPLNESQRSETPRLREIARLLAGDPPEAPVEPTSIVSSFATAAEQPGCRTFRAQLCDRCGTPGRPWRSAPDHGIAAEGIMAYSLAGCRKQKEIADWQTRARDAGTQLVLGNIWMPGEPVLLTHVPTPDKFAVIAVVGTQGNLPGPSTAEIVAWLREVDHANPFELTYCTHDMVGGAFSSGVKKARELAEQMIEFCPDCIGEVLHSSDELAAAIRKLKSFLLRWG